MDFFSAIAKWFSGSSNEETKKTNEFKTENWTGKRIRKQGVNPMVRNADDDYHAVSTNYTAANRLARDCARS